MPRFIRILIVLTALAAVLVVGGRPVFAADQTAAGTSSQGFTEGSLTLQASGDSAVLVADGLAPGARLGGCLTIENTGSVDAQVVLHAHTEGSPRLAEALHLVVERVGAGKRDVVYSGSLAGLQDRPAGLLAAGEGQKLRLSVTLPADSGNEFQGAAATTTFSWTAKAA